MAAKIQLHQSKVASLKSDSSKSVPSRRFGLQHNGSGDGALVIKSILVPIDFSPRSLYALKVAVQLARMFGAKLSLLHVDEPMGLPDFSNNYPLVLKNDTIIAKGIRDLQKTLLNMDLEPGLVEKIIVRQGRAFHEIAEAAQSLNSDLIVIATHGYKGLTHALLGSTSERVVQHAKCPVFVVRKNETKAMFRT